ncbi:MAG: glycosyltransferase [Bacteriovoracia bacterium]
MAKRVLIFVVAYNAENHIRGKVLDRLPSEVFNHPDFHILIIDDCSKDRTAELAAQHVVEKGYDNVSVLRNAVNQGYGGNQKLGYRYAVENGFDLVIMLHGDGQYAPELVLEFVKSWQEKDADVVLGSRMMNKTSARKGGMPLYKWFGNQILTFFQNQLVDSKLTEFHTGYRAYSTRFLRSVPFELNTDVFHFDTEILLQAFAKNSKVVEFPIPTHYGDEICHVNGMQYAWDVIKACIKFRSQKIGFFSSMQYRGLLNHQEIYDETNESMDNFHHRSAASMYGKAARLVNDRSSVLSFGYNPGFVSKILADKKCMVSSVSPDVMTKDQSSQDLRKYSVAAYDEILALGVLEQIDDAERFLVQCRYSMAFKPEPKQPRFLLSAKNVGFIGLRVLLGLGYFNYGERGILTVRTKRLFTLSSLKRMLSETGYEVSSVTGLGVPFYLLFDGRFGRFLYSVSESLAKLWPSLLAYQLVVEAKPKGNALLLLSSAQKFRETEVEKTSKLQLNAFSEPVRDRI